MFGRQCISAWIKQMVQSTSHNCIFFTASSSFRASASCAYLSERYFYQRAPALSPLNFSICLMQMSSLKIPSVDNIRNDIRERNTGFRQKSNVLQYIFLILLTRKQYTMPSQKYYGNAASRKDQKQMGAIHYRKVVLCRLRTRPHLRF